ncbi:MurR/RpiR family transcriptional regulator [Ponticoccus litoralis]|uniref:MurR/RpiR family transcriptional regulator n=1 Tax=Ponticoccus litoralis TaxID=422297 RepID=A0AAW9SIG1_9RHOB
MTPPPNAPRAAAPNDVITALSDMDRHFAAREQRVAEVVKANLEAVTQMTIADLAALAEVSTPTVVRFCRTLGCDGFRDFKMVLAQNLAVSRQYLDPPVAPGATGGVEVVQQVQDAALRSMATLEAQIDADTFERARSAIAGCRSLLAIGVGGGSSMTAEEAANRFFRLGRIAVATSDPYLMQMRAAAMQPGDVLLAFSNSGHAAEVIAALRVARSYGATTVCITRDGSPRRRPPRSRCASTSRKSRTSTSPPPRVSPTCCCSMRWPRRLRARPPRTAPTGCGGCARR